MTQIATYSEQPPGPADNAAPVHHTSGGGQDDIVRLALRSKTRLAVSVAAGLVVGGVLFAAWPSKYTAYSQIMVAPRQPDIAETDATIRRLWPEREPDVTGEAEIVGSRAAREEVVRHLGLHNLPEFNPALRDKPFGDGLVGEALRTGLAQVKEAVAAGERALGIGKTSAVSEDPVERAVEQLEQQLRIGPVKHSTIVEIAASSRDADTAARIANQLAEGYTKRRHLERVQQAERATQWLGERSRQLQEDALVAERKAEAFRARNGVAGARDAEQLRLEMAKLVEALSTARAGQERASARLAAAEVRVAQSGILATLESFESPLAERLRASIGELKQREANTAAMHGWKHPDTLKVNAELQAARGELEREAHNRMNMLRMEDVVSTRHVAQLNDALHGLRDQLDGLNAASVALHALERDAEGSRAVYQNFLDRLKTTEQVGFDNQQSWIVSTATPPLRPSSPQPVLVFAGCLVAALGVGFSSMLLKEGRLGRTLRSTEEVPPLYGLRGLALVPAVSRRRRIRMPVYGRGVLKPNTAFTESVAALHTALAPPRRPDDGPGHTCLFTSALPFEGKSTTVSALAAFIASSGSRVLVVDADLRSPSLHRLFGVDGARGLGDCLVGSASADEVIQVAEGSGVSVMPAGSARMRFHEALRSPRLKDLLAELRTRFDFILIDTPPVLPVSDARILSPLADDCVLVVRWSRTQRQAVEHALHLLADAQANIAGIVLTQVDLKGHARYGYGDSAQYRREYKGRYASR